jgi:hypothetical protein
VARPGPLAGELDEKVLSCPACWSWQLHYTREVSLLWPPATFEAMVESILREHVAYECPNPRLIKILVDQRDGHLMARRSGSGIAR